MTTTTLRRKLSKAYDEGRLKLHLTQDESVAFNWAMYFWQSSHSRYNLAEYTTEQYARARKKRLIDLCMNGAKYTIK